MTDERPQTAADRMLQEAAKAQAHLLPPVAPTMEMRVNRSDKGEVILQFKQPVTMCVMSPAQARRLAIAIIENAEEQ